jgi:hypothetical protein
VTHTSSHWQSPQASFCKSIIVSVSRCTTVTSWLAVASVDCWQDFIKIFSVDSVPDMIVWFITERSENSIVPVGVVVAVMNCHYLNYRQLSCVRRRWLDLISYGVISYRFNINMFLWQRGRRTFLTVNAERNIRHIWRLKTFEHLLTIRCQSERQIDMYFLH